MSSASMVNSSTDLINLALVKLGEPFYEDLNETSPTRKLVDFMYPKIIKLELTKTVYNFSRKFATLAALNYDPSTDYGYKHAFALPADYLKLVGLPNVINDSFVVYNDQRNMGYVEAVVDGFGRVIMLNYNAPLRIEYVQYVDTAAFYSPEFVNVVACSLALECSKKVNYSTNEKQQLIKDYEIALSRAIRTNALQTATSNKLSGTFVNSRLVGR